MFATAFSEDDNLLASYRFDLPQDQIAQHPGERGASRLLVVDRCALSHCHSRFAELPDFLPEGALLVANNSRVVPARLNGERAGGGKVEFLLLTPLSLVVAAVQEEGGVFYAEADCLLKPGKRARVGDTLDFGRDESLLRVHVLEKGEFGRHKVRLSWTGDGGAGSLRQRFESMGHLPLPPYIRRPDTEEDARRYQTIYARNDKAGSVAAPTAGLHFTGEIRERLRQKGVEWAEVTLHVGYGTFSPVRCADVREHVMHPEYVEVSAETAQAVNKAKKEGRPVLAVGTTSARTLEGVANLHAAAAASPAEREGRESSSPLAPYAGWVNMFIRPGYQFRVIDGLITNFHLPESTLLMLVSALTGRERMLDLYAEAVREGYRFFSYGDAMLIRE